MSIVKANPGKFPTPASRRLAGVASVAALSIAGAGLQSAAALEPSPGVAETTPGTATLPEKWPMKWDLGIGVGFEGISKDTGLGNAAYRTDGTSRNVPESSGLVALRGTAWVLDELGIELEGKLVPTTIAPSGSGGHANIYGVRANAVYQFMAEQNFRPFVSAGAGFDIFKSSESKADLESKNIGVLDTADADSAFLVGTGFKWQALHDIGVRLDLRWLSTRGIKDAAGEDHLITSNFEGMLAVVYTLGGKPADTDSDGILDPFDKCPEQAEDKDGFQDADGCLDPDNDGDSLVDLEDKCPNEAEDKDGFEDYDGCPDLDNDKDGVPDTQDKCANEPETKNGFQDDDGCPDAADKDKDGISDDKDKCPDQPETKNGFQDDDGCPDIADKDKDGIEDAKDKCADKPETKNGFQDDDGCPDELSADILKITTGSIAGIAWKKDGTLDEKKSLPVLQPIAETLVKTEGVKVLLKVASAAVDKAGAQARADALKGFLVSRGVEMERIEAVGESTLPEAPAADPKKKPAKAPAAPADTVTLTVKM